MVGCGRAVLVVDDDVNLLEFITTVLDAAGVESVAARTGEAAWGALRANEVGIALVDLHLAGEDGVELARAMRSGGALAEIVLMSGDPNLARLANEAGIGRTLAKPFEVGALFELVAEPAAPDSRAPSVLQQPACVHTEPRRERRERRFVRDRPLVEDLPE